LANTPIPATQAGTIVEVAGLTKIYGGDARKRIADVLAVDDVHLAVGEGELVVLLGPSGCGKTTLLRCIAGLEKPDRGEIRIGERTVFSSARRAYVPPEARRIGMMFQSYALWPHMTVFQNVAYPLASLASHRKEATPALVDDLLRRLGVAGLDHRYPGELSGGQQQRVALARALVASPSVILFDEPLSNVDAKVRRRLRAELRDLKAQTGFAGIYVTHDQEEAMELADTLAVMEAGRIRQRDTGREVYCRPASVYVADFVGEINRWQGRIEEITGGSAIASSPMGRFAISEIGADVRRGDTGWIAIRPERVALQAPAGDGGGPLRGHVHDAIYLGARLEYRVRLPQMEMTAWMPDRQDPASLPRRGDPVDVVLAEDSIRWLAQ
jgi:iron(III) transport system ATP-binding protein